MEYLKGKHTKGLRTSNQSLYIIKEHQACNFFLYRKYVAVSSLQYSAILLSKVSKFLASNRPPRKHCSLFQATQSFYYIHVFGNIYAYWGWLSSMFITNLCLLHVSLVSYFLGRDWHDLELFNFFVIHTKLV